MIVSKQKNVDELMYQLKDSASVFIVGCGDCATTCATGGEKQVKILSDIMQDHQIPVSGTIIVDTACDERLIRRDLKKVLKPEDTVLVLSCGSGVQAVGKIIDNIVIPGLDSLFLAKIKNLSHFEKVCSMCGNCVLGETGGICPVTRCPKHLRNGPCGGSSDGKCEVNRDHDCAWYLIYERLKELDSLDDIKKYQTPRDCSNDFKRDHRISRK